MKHVPESEFLESAVALGDPPRDERRAVELTGYLIRENNDIVDIKVQDLSYDGCGILTLVPLMPGEKVKLTVLGRGAESAVVRWCKLRQAGLQFRSDNSKRTKWPRKAERAQVSAELTLRRSGRSNYRVTAYDITRFGCKCEFIERPAIYERMWVKFDGLEAMESVVCWVEESKIGLMYQNPIHPAVFDMLLARFGLPMEETVAGRDTDEISSAA